MPIHPIHPLAEVFPWPITADLDLTSAAMAAKQLALIIIIWIC